LYRIGKLKPDGNVVVNQTLKAVLPMILQRNEVFDIGADRLPWVNDDASISAFALTANPPKLTGIIDG
jgi:hypothetical protein